VVGGVAEGSAHFFGVRVIGRLAARSVFLSRHTAARPHFRRHKPVRKPYYMEENKKNAKFSEKYLTGFGGCAIVLIEIFL
jgi:hypothetical protein